MKYLLGFAFAALMASQAFAQTYECRSSTTPGQINQQNVPCAKGADARDISPAEQSRRRAEKMEQDKYERDANAYNKIVNEHNRIASVVMNWGNPTSAKTELFGSESGQTFYWDCPTNYQWNSATLVNGRYTRLVQHWTICPPSK
jgi:hypothetical protein